MKRAALLKQLSEWPKFPEMRRIREDEEKFGGKSSGENKERQKETGFLRIRMLELNRHFGIREGGGINTERESDSGFTIKELRMGLQQLGNAHAAAAENI